jgi:hypothetical protein
MSDPKITSYLGEYKRSFEEQVKPTNELAEALGVPAGKSLFIGFTRWGPEIRSVFLRHSYFGAVFVSDRCSDPSQFSYSRYAHRFYPSDKGAL